MDLSGVRSGPGSGEPFEIQAIAESGDAGGPSAAGAPAPAPAAAPAAPAAAAAAPGPPAEDCRKGSLVSRPSHNFDFFCGHLGVRICIRIDLHRHPHRHMYRHLKRSEPARGDVLVIRTDPIPPAGTRDPKRFEPAHRDVLVIRIDPISPAGTYS